MKATVETGPSGDRAANGGIRDVADAWLPGVWRLPSGHDGGASKGGAPRVVWHTSESDPQMSSALSVAQRLERQGRNAHLVWNPGDGEIVQMVPATWPSCTLPGEVGREGRQCLQIVVVGFAREPFTGGPLIGMYRIVRWLDLWRVPRRWPAGRPPAFPEARVVPRARRLWARGGYFGVSQVPQSSDPAPGAIDIHKITGPDTPLGVPRPRPAPSGGWTHRPGAAPARSPS